MCIDGTDEESGPGTESVSVEPMGVKISDDACINDVYIVMMKKTYRECLRYHPTNPQ